MSIRVPSTCTALMLHSNNTTLHVSVLKRRSAKSQMELMQKGPHVVNKMMIPNESLGFVLMKQYLTQLTVEML